MAMNGTRRAQLAPPGQAIARQGQRKRAGQVILAARLFSYQGTARPAMTIVTAIRADPARPLDRWVTPGVSCPPSHALGGLIVPL